MAITKDDVVEYLKAMTLLEASELVKELEEVFGVSAAAAAAPMMMAAPGGGDALRRRKRRIRLTLSLLLLAAIRSRSSRSFAKSLQASASRKRRIWSTVLRKRSKKAFRRTKPKRSRPSLRKLARRSKSNSKFRVPASAGLPVTRSETGELRRVKPGLQTKFVSIRPSC